MSFTSTPPHVTSFCAQAAEVEVDPDTGQVTVKKMVTAHDVGMILNPLTHQGQIEGGMIQGLGYADGRITDRRRADFHVEPGRVQDTDHQGYARTGDCVA